MSENNDSFSIQVNESINHICDELSLTSFVRAKCLDKSSNMNPKEDMNITKPIANAIACAIVSIVHEDAKNNGRVRQHLPDRMIAKVFGLNSVDIVYNKRLINSMHDGNSEKIANMIG